ncbi:MAG TPA: TcpE family conjugal transfer membrane protein, partial [Trebonia sp.]
ERIQVDLPTYTNIWRIEKRLYKLYDFRLPAPLPISWIAVFAGITIPYIIILVTIGLPFNHSLVWLYVLPPGVLTWLTTRPVIEGKRLPELVESQLRYLTEPRVWCRLAPLAEKDQIIVTARVWHSRRVPKRQKAGDIAQRAPGRPVHRENAAAGQAAPAVPGKVPDAVGLGGLGFPSEAGSVSEMAAAGQEQGTTRGKTTSPSKTPATSGQATGPGKTTAPGKATSPGKTGPGKSRSGAGRPTRGRPAVFRPGGRARGVSGGGDATAGDERLILPGSAPDPESLAGRPAGRAPKLPSGPFPSAPHAPAPAGPAPAAPVSGGQPVAPARAWPPAGRPAASTPASSAVAPDAPARSGPPSWPAAPAGSLPGLSRRRADPAPLGPGSAPVRSTLPPHATPDVNPDYRLEAPSSTVAPGASAPAPVSAPESESVSALTPPTAPEVPTAPEAAKTPAPASASETVGAALEAVKAPEPADAPEPTRVPEAAKAPEGAALDVVRAPEEVPAEESEAAKASETVVAPEPVQASEPQQAPEAEPVPEAEQASDAEPVSEAEQASEPQREPGPERLRVRGGGAPRLEVTHNEVSGRPPAAAAHTWPTPPRPLRSVTPPAPQSPAANEPAPQSPAPEAPAPKRPAAAPASPVIPGVPEGPVVPDRSAAPSGPVVPPAAAGKTDKPATEKPGRQVPARRANPIAAALAGAGTGEGQTPASVPGDVTPPAEVKTPLSAPTIERALSGKSRDRNLSWRGTVKVVTGKTQGPGARDQEALDRARARLPLKQAKRVLILGCTSGAGQTVTTLMTGHILASLREHPVAAVDLDGGTLARYGAPAAWLEDVLRGQPPQHNSSPRPDGLNPNAKGSHARLDVVASREPLQDGDEIKLAVQFGRHYPLTMLDPGAHGLTRLLKIADQLVIVVPASVEAAGALADTREWLDAHGFGELVAHSVTLINGVSRRSLADVEAAESVARGRCRAIVRVPWDEMLQAGVAGPSTLRPQTRVAYTALAGVLVAGMAAAPVRIKK